MTNATEIKKFIQEVGEKIRELGSSINQKKQEIADLEQAPLTKAETTDLLTGLVDREADAFSDHLDRWIAQCYINRPRDDHGEQRFNILHVFNNAYMDRSKVSSGMLICLLRDPIKEALVKHLEAYSFPEKAVSLEERKQRIAILEGQIQSAEQELQSLQQDLKEAGVQTIPRPAATPNYSGGVPLSALPKEMQGRHHHPAKVEERQKPRKDEIKTFKAS